MATNHVVFKIPKEDILAISAEHSVSIMGDGAYKLNAKLSIDANSEAAYTTGQSIFSIPLDFAQSTSAITSIKFFIESEVSGASDINSFSLSVGDRECSLAPGENNIDTSVISYINLLQSQNKVFPELYFKVQSRVYKGESTTGESTDASVSFSLRAPEIGCLLRGGQAIYRPASDIAVGHALQEGFSGVYQLLNEENADDDITYIESYGSSDHTVEDLRESIIAVDSQLPSRVMILQLRLSARLFLSFGSSNVLSRATGGVTLLVSIPGLVSVSFKQTSAPLSVYGDAAWHEDEYYTFEGIISANSSLITAINSYYEMHGVMPEIQVSITTAAEGTQNSSKGNSDGIVRVSQIYLEAVYEDFPCLNIYYKRSNGWTQIQTAYKKQDGSWVEITEDECRDILQNNLLLNG